MRALLLAMILLLATIAGCSMSKSAERQDSFGQEVESRRDEGPWTREVWEYAEGSGVFVLPGAPIGVLPEKVKRNDQAKAGQRPTEAASTGPIRHILETHAPIVTSTQTKTDASGEAHTASASRFGFSPWQWAIGAAVLAALAYVAFWVKRKLAL